MKSFIVEFWSRVFGALRWLSVFELVRHLVPGLKTHGVIDIWVLSNLGFATISAIIAPCISNDWIQALLISYGLLRIFEVVIYQINVLLFDEYRARKASSTYALRGYRRLVILLLQNYIEIIFWFAAIYVILNMGFEFKTPGTTNTFFGGFYSSFIIMTTFGEPNIVPKAPWGAILILFQSGIGLFMTLLTLARFISLIPTPESSDEFEKCKHRSNKPLNRTRLMSRRLAKH